LTEELEHWARTQERGLGARTAFGDAEEDRVLAWPLDALVQPLEPGRLPEEALGLWREITNQPTPNHTALPV